MNRYKRFDILLLCCFAAAVAALFWAEPPASFRSLQHFWNLGHILLFFLFSRVAVILFPAIGSWRPGKKFILLFTLALLLGGAIELYQRFTPGRDASFADLAADLAGPLLYLGIQRGIGKRQRLVLLATVVFFASFSLVPGLAMLSDEITAARQFPLLADFETPFENYRFTCQGSCTISDRAAYSGRKSLLLKLTTDRYSGIGLQYFNGDWSAYKTFSCAVFNPGSTPVNLHLRIHDLLHERGTMEYSDRYNTTFRLLPGWNSLRVSLEDVRNAPKGRKMDMGTIRGVGFFVAHEPEPLTLFLDTLKLKK